MLARAVTLQGTNFVHFMVRYVYVLPRPTHLKPSPSQSILSLRLFTASNLHKLAYKDDFDKFVGYGRELKEH